MTDNEENKMTWFEASQEIAKAMKEYEDDLDKMAAECPSEMKLAVTRWVMKHIVAHAKECASYRYLIYNRLGFGPEAYAPLLDDGMFISNEFDVKQMDNIKTKVREERIEILKPLLNMCDEPGCFKNAGCGWPSENGYRMTCYEHMKEGKNER